MRITDFTRSALAYRRFERRAKADGFEQVSENGAPLWKFHRGGWTRERITDVRISPSGQELWIKHTAAARAAREHFGEFAVLGD